MSPFRVIARGIEHSFMSETEAQRLVVKERTIAKFAPKPSAVELFHYGELVAKW